MQIMSWYHAILTNLVLTWWFAAQNHQVLQCPHSPNMTSLRKHMSILILSLVRHVLCTPKLTLMQPSHDMINAIFNITFMYSCYSCEQCGIYLWKILQWLEKNISHSFDKIWWCKNRRYPCKSTKRYQIDGDGTKIGETSTKICGCFIYLILFN
jgi:histidinol phosphatase-like enzyme